MTRFDIQRSRTLLQGFDFHDLFIEELGWSQPSQTRPDTVDCDGVTYTRRQIAHLSGVVVFELTAEDGQIPLLKHAPGCKSRSANIITRTFWSL